MLPLPRPALLSTHITTIMDSHVFTALERTLHEKPDPSKTQTQLFPLSRADESAWGAINHSLRPGSVRGATGTPFRSAARDLSVDAMSMRGDGFNTMRPRNSRPTRAQRLATPEQQRPVEADQGDKMFLQTAVERTARNYRTAFGTKEPRLISSLNGPAGIPPMFKNPKPVFDANMGPAEYDESRHSGDVKVHKSHRWSPAFQSPPRDMSCQGMAARGGRTIRFVRGLRPRPRRCFNGRGSFTCDGRICT